MREKATKRVRFQVHLSTAIAIMLVGAGMVWANFSPSIQLGLSTNLSAWEGRYGWPLTARWASWNEPYRGQTASCIPNHAESGWAPLGVFVNVTFAVSVILLIAKQLEKRISGHPVRPKTCPYLTELLVILTLAVLLALNVYYVRQSPIAGLGAVYEYRNGWPVPSLITSSQGIHCKRAQPWNIAFALCCLIFVYWACELPIRIRSQRLPGPQGIGDGD